MVKTLGQYRVAAIKIQRMIRRVKQKGNESILLSKAIEYMQMLKKLTSLERKLTSNINNDADKQDLDNGDMIDART